ncbi:hypothetical protein H7J93_16485 [Mycobacterium barrassiae]|uniref:hypothetical protein n=1 Tax=Mycobacterium barrassiae TaxID=319709 RepID=UPI002265B3E1|nr:hypothetical protein [Mycobacterium barrassiae]MCV7301218.1 hypothetical protein [Mycobacterium barrassiae]
MNDVTRWPDDLDEFSARQLADRSGISATTITKWAAREDDPLPAQTSGNRKLFRWGDLVAFSNRHPELSAARNFLNRIRTRPNNPANELPQDRETIRAIAQYARAAAAAASDAALETAELHLKTVRSLRTTIAALDSALTLALPSETLHD